MMSLLLSLSSLASSYAGAKARQLCREAILVGFVCLMALVAIAALFGAFIVLVAETHGLVYGMLAGAGLALALAVLALGLRALVRRRDRRRTSVELSSNASAVAISGAASLIARNKTTAILAGLAIGAIAASLTRPSRS
ncbi:hypothetical protein PZ897_01920 [Hoeflea sp. YIM 152468]|uniref:hypothetical protein n=1 Tax=Hoeflea sp. YIM 152468 TaxID=3031759 RepID=UPI0023DCA11D|nr:hypothetical protein [Hoeflea sp. YIM 152468]MDF1606927.1 hypothetical protein [Hoeflea sp. YIM 152468]